MKAMVYYEYGSPDVLALQEIEEPVVNDDQVLVRVHAASVNWLDWHFLTGTPFLARLLYGNQVDLTVFNDAGPVVANLNAVGDVAARANDWRVADFYPDSCTGCDPLGQATELIQWRLDNDSTVREAFYSTDGDEVARFFNRIPTQAAYRTLILMEHERLNANHPDRYKTFIVSGDDSHTALQTPLFQTQDANGILLNDWTDHFTSPRKPFWTQLIEEFVPIP